jgi:ATP-dependent Clp protease adaptor protein ClpS
MQRAQRGREKSYHRGMSTPADPPPASPAAPPPQTATATLTRERPTRRQPRPWNVVLLNDDDHTFPYVIDMLGRLFGHPEPKALKIAKTVDKDGRAVCMTTHKELAELKCEQITSFGADPLSKTSKGSMSAIIEPADFGGDDE